MVLGLILGSSQLVLVLPLKNGSPSLTAPRMAACSLAYPLLSSRTKPPLGLSSSNSIILKGKNIIFENGSKEIRWLYDSNGTKLQKKVIQDGEVVETRDCFGGIEYLNGNLEAVYHADGRWVDGLFTYTVKDHLGNSRVSFADLNSDGDLTVGGPESEIMQENHYYPFGMNMEGEGASQIGPENKYQYNGKELNEEFGLNWRTKIRFSHG